mmetsp:Transcript_18154/g.26287  ORF Transcript_18154/g.26287 Transcript_18154/m.26287 type:complete len:395 (+) Transcript_18154:51-1235(+)
MQNFSATNALLCSAGERMKVTAMLGTVVSEAESLFGLLPEEVIRMIFGWMDVPSLSVLIQSSKPVHSSISLLASGDDIWVQLANRRFNIVSTSRTNRIIREPRPKPYGGADWRAAYRSMSSCSRMPKNRIMSKRSTLFAKGLKGAVLTPGESLPRKRGDFVGVWVTVAHTDDCNTRLIRYPTEEDQESRFIELHLCLQNTRSGYGTVDFDIANASVQIIGSPRDVNDLWFSDVVRSGPYRPKILYRKREGESIRMRKKKCKSFLYPEVGNGRHLYGKESQNESPTDLTCTCDHLNNSGSLSCLTTLQPFEFVIVSVHVPCAPDMRFETEFLSRAICLYIPVRWNNGANQSKYKKPAIDCLASAPFLPEADIWKYYMELPGDCLTLTDRDGLVSA